MKRDDDLIRKMMFEAEASEDWIVIYNLHLRSSPEEQTLHYHAELLADAGLMTQTGSKGVYRLTNAGHDWLNAVRDDTVWIRTKEGAAKVGSVSLQLMGSIAMGYLKEKLAEHGIPMA